MADDLIEEIKQKAFDEQTVEWKAIPVEQLTNIDAFGIIDPGEYSVSDFDDIDDYHEYQKAVSLPHVENYTVMSTVDYVSASNPDVTS